MELRQLIYFTTLAETLNFHRAAERLNISQPPLTVAIRKLETELGTPLFIRGARGVVLTPAGETALEVAKTTLMHAARFREAALEGSIGERGRLRVGFVGSAIFELLPRIIPAYRRAYPKVDLILEEATSVDIVRRVAAGQMDVGLVRLPLTEIAAVETEVVETDDLVAAVPSTSPFASMESVPLQSLAREPFILQSSISVFHAISLMACHDAGFVPKVAQQAVQMSAILSLVQSGLGVALVPSKARRSVPEGVKLVHLTKRVPIESGIALASSLASRAAKNFQALAIEGADIQR